MTTNNFVSNPDFHPVDGEPQAPITESVELAVPEPVAPELINDVVESSPI